jgi:rSAM/selenodomain-associated transferase 2
MKLSVIVPALNESENIVQAVSSALTAGAEEVIVVDGGSQDDTVERATAAGAICLVSQPGRAQQLHHGASHARGEMLVFLHADNWFGQDALAPLLENAPVNRGDPLNCGGFRQQIEAPQSIYRWLEWGNRLRIRWLGSAYGDQGIFVRREIYEASGGFPLVPLMEDVLLMRQLRRRYKVTLLPGPLHVSPRRWQANGPIRQTIRNWSLMTAFRCGVSPERLARFYRRHTA